MHNLIPHFIYEQYEQGHSHGRLQAITLFLDISGFTAITESLMQHGKEGAEVLAGIINEVFDPIIKAVYERGGFITGFAGDAFTAVFPTYNEPTALIACASALLIRQTFMTQGHQQTEFGDFVLDVRLGLSAGAVEWAIAGSENHKTYFFRGEAIVGCTKAEQQAQGGEIVADKQIQALIPPTAVSLSPLYTSYAKLITLNLKANYPLTQSPSIPTIPQFVGSQFFPQTVWQMTQQGEFRDVATIFVSLQGVPTLDTMNTFMSKVMELIDQYDGFFVETEFGDKGGLFLVYFGAPTTHEKDVERALSFILAMQTELSGVGVMWRAGLTYGTVYAGYIGTSLRDKYSCLGSMVNLAARLMMQAEWGQVLVSKSIALHPSFDFISLGQLPYKGFDQPVSTYLLQGETIATQVFQQKMVGRDRELQELLNFAQLLFVVEASRVAIVYGEAGIGKSHLVYALGQKLGANVRWLTGQCDPILREAFNPFIYFLKGYFGQASTATDAVNKANFEHRLQDLLSNLTIMPDSKRQYDELVRTQSFLGALLDLYWPDSLYEQLDGKGRYENTIIAVSMLLQAECRRQPVVLALEDGHWLDKPSQELLMAVTRQIKDASLLIVITSRYADDGSQPTYNIDLDTPTLKMDLTTLTAEAIQELAQAIVGTPISAALHTILIEKAEVNPFFSQQILYYLQENHLLQVDKVEGDLITTLTTEVFELPITINALLVARLDRLTQRVKEVVQTAAVLGREFELRLLSQMLKREIKSEVALAEQKQIWSWLNELQYIFKHALMRDAAYDMQLRAQLRTLHELAAQAAEVLYANQLPSYYGILAYHYEMACQWGSTTVQDRACHYLQAAGQQALTHFENWSAVDYFSRALALTAETDVEQRYHLLLSREKAYDLLAEREAQAVDLTTLQQLTTVLDEEGTLLPEWAQRQAVVACRQAISAESMSDYESAILWAQKGARLAQTAADSLTLAQTQATWGRALQQQGDYATARKQYQLGVEALQLAAVAVSGDTASVAQSVLALNLNGLGNGAWQLGDYVAARAYHEQALAIRQKIGSRRELSSSLNNLGIVANDSGDYARAKIYYERSLAIDQEIGDRRGVGITLNNLGVLTWQFGDYVGAKAYYEQALAIRQEIGDRWGVSLAWSNLGLTHYGQGDIRLAHQHSQQAVELARELGAHYVLGYALTHLGHALLAQGIVGIAKTVYQEAYDLWQGTRQINLAMEPLAGLARVALAQHELATAKHCVEPILTHLASKKLDGSLYPSLVHLSCVQTLQVVGDKRLAAVLARAQGLIQTQAAKIPAGEMREMYLAIPAHQALMTFDVEGV